MRLLHTSDWHLGRHFYGRSLLHDQEYVIDQMINLARDLNPDVMVVSGDVFHHRRPSEETLELFHDTLNRLLGLDTILVFLGGPTDDFRNLHLNARWVRDAGVYLFEDATQVLSPLNLKGARDDFEVNAWCLPYPKTTDLTQGSQHPALFGHTLVEKVVQRLNPSEVNIFLGYAWGQDAGRQEEFGNLIAPGGRPLEKRLLEFFDVAALGGRHEPIALGGCEAHYSGSLLCYETESANKSRSVTFYEINGKNKIYVDQYPLKPRRSFKVLEGSWEELVEAGRDLRSDDLVVLRSEDRDLNPEQRAELRILAPNVVSVELPSIFDEEQKDESEPYSSLVRAFRDFCKDVGDVEIGAESLTLLQEIEESL